MLIVLVQKKKNTNSISKTANDFSMCMKWDTRIICKVRSEDLETEVLPPDTEPYTDPYADPYHVEEEDDFFEIDILDEIDENGVMKTIFSATIETIYQLHFGFEELQVESALDEQLVFADVTAIWRAEDPKDKRQIVRLTENNGNIINLSHEHLVYVNGSTIIAKHVMLGDIMTIAYGTTLIESRVASVEFLTESLNTPYYDIEIGGTENLFANNIKVHNCRWL